MGHPHSWARTWKADYIASVPIDAWSHSPPKLTAASFLAVSLVLESCGSVSVRPSPSGFTASPRPGDCNVEFLRSAPSRSYDTIAEVYGYYSYVAEPEDVLRQKACELGADAVVVTVDFLVSTSRSPDRKMLSGLAIKYRDRS